MHMHMAEGMKLRSRPPCAQQENSTERYLCCARVYTSTLTNLLSKVPATATLLYNPHVGDVEKRSRCPRKVLVWAWWHVKLNYMESSHVDFRAPPELPWGCRRCSARYLEELIEQFFEPHRHSKYVVHGSCCLLKLKDTEWEHGDLFLILYASWSIA